MPCSVHNRSWRLYVSPVDYAGTYNHGNFEFFVVHPCLTSLRTTSSHSHAFQFRFALLFSLRFSPYSILTVVGCSDICEHYDCIGSKLSHKDNIPLQYKPIAYFKLESAKMFVLCGDELPDIASQLDQDQIDYYYTALLTLFKPHREHTLLNPNESPSAGYRSFTRLNGNVQSKRMQQFEERWRDYHCAQRNEDQGKESMEENLLRTRAPPSTAWTPIDDVNDSRHDNDDYFDDSIPHHLFDLSTIAAPDTSTGNLSQNSVAIVRDIPQLETVLHSASDAYNVSKRITLGDDFICSSYASHIIAPGVATDSEEYVGTQTFISQFRDAPTRLERLRECFAPVPYQSLDTPPRWTPKTLLAFPEIAMASEAFKMNFWQHVAFEVAARHLLYAYSEDIADTLSEPMLPVNFNCNSYGIRP